MTTLRLLFALLLTLGVAFVATNVADAEDDERLEFATFDISDIVAEHRPNRAPTLGIPDMWGGYPPSRRQK